MEYLWPNPAKTQNPNPKPEDVARVYGYTGTLELTSECVAGPWWSVRNRRGSGSSRGRSPRAAEGAAAAGGGTCPTPAPWTAHGRTVQVDPIKPTPKALGGAG